MSSTMVLDLRGVVFPVCLLKCKSALEEMNSGVALEVLVEDPAVVRDMVKIIRRSRGGVIKTRREENHYRVLIGPTRKGSAQ